MSNRNLIQKIIFASAFFGGIIFGIMILAFSDFDGIRKLQNYQPKIPSQLLDIHGNLISEFFIQKRKLIKIEDTPTHLSQAFIAMEDNRFYDHIGVDPRGIIRAFFVNLLAGRVKEGGSTITQQLAKVMLTNRERSFTRKFKEAWISILIEFHYSKAEILNLYFNQIYLGHGAYGVEAASNFYFNKSTREISIAEAALLASLPSAPNIFSPFKNPQLSREKQKTVLIRMVENGFITKEKAEKELHDFWNHFQEKLSAPSMSAWGNRVDKAPYFTEYIRRILEPELGKDSLFAGGLKIYTTLDLHLQESAEKVLEERLKIQRLQSKERVVPNEEIISDAFSSEWQILSYLLALKPVTGRVSETQKIFASRYAAAIHDDLSLLNFFAGSAGVGETLTHFENDSEAFMVKDQVEAALISLDYESGGIRAMIGGSGFRSDNQFNRTIQMRRQTGSSFKPFVYATGMELKKVTPATVIDDTPLLYLDEMGDFWTPENYTGEYLGPIRLRKALELSRNVISVRVAEKVGIEKIINRLAMMLNIHDQKKIASRFPANLSIALGSADLSPLEMAQAYSVFARGGRAVTPHAILKITDMNGKVILDYEKKIAAEYKKLRKEDRYQVLSPTTATLMTSMLKSAARSGTGSLATTYYKKTIAGKTGTTNNFKDAWFVGYNHTITTALWFGYDRNGLTLGPGQSGGNIAAPTVGKYYALSQGKVPDKYFGSYGAVVSKRVCAKSGLVPAPGCREVLEEIFAPGTEPSQSCDKCVGSGSVQVRFENLDDKKIDSLNQNTKIPGKPGSSTITKDSLFND